MKPTQITVNALQCKTQTMVVGLLTAAGLVWPLTQSHGINQQDAQLSQRDRAAGCVIVFPKSRRL